ncbi:DUF4440 domain-containing protein [Pseudoalteromonas sp. T1lg65]|uniref:DUF4440 domain-containing protein n=1 Tax=Pseudoalteromonas sp. T1lg65 TaxID=2077101 RepID=UPI003F7928B1
MEALFSHYTSAFDAFDAKAIASLYRLPCAIADADGVQVYSEKDTLIQKFSANCEKMRDFGYQSAEFNIVDVQVLSDTQNTVTLEWRIHTKGAHIDFHTLYLCHKVENQWRIFSANVYPGSFNKPV